MKIKPNEIVYIEWIDSATAPGWLSPEEVTEATVLPCATVGFFVKRDKIAITLAMNMAPTAPNDYGDLMSVPNSCITTMFVIKGG